MSEGMGPEVQRLADRCTCAVNGLRSTSARDMADAMLDAMHGRPELDEMGSDEVDELIAFRHESTAYALEFLLFGDARRLDRWVERYDRQTEAIKRGATPAGQPHRTLGTWEAGRPE